MDLLDYLKHVMGLDEVPFVEEEPAFTFSLEERSEKDE